MRGGTGSGEAKLDLRPARAREMGRALSLRVGLPSLATRPGLFRTQARAAACSWEVSVALFQHRAGEHKRSCRTTEVAFPGTGGSALTQLFACFSFQLLKKVLEYQRHELRTVHHRDERSKKAFSHPNVE